MGGIIMRQFNLEEYVKNPARPIVTRDGRAARVLCTDRISDTWPVVALVRDEEGEAVRTFHENGECHLIDESPDPCDLFFAPEKRTGWINVYHYDGVGNANASRRIYDTKEEALACENKGRIDTIKIEWEE